MISNAPVAYDLGFRREGDTPVWFVLDDRGNEVHQERGWDGPYICSDQELRVQSWIRSQGAEINYLPSYHYQDREHSGSIMNLFEKFCF